MKDDIKIDKFHKREAKELVSMLFDKRFLNDELSRDSIDWLEDYMGFLFQSKAQMTEKSTLLLASLRDKA